MFNVLYSIAGGIALGLSALGASGDFDGEKAAQLFFNHEEEAEVVIVEPTEVSPAPSVVKTDSEADEFDAIYRNCLYAQKFFEHEDNSIEALSETMAVLIHQEKVNDKTQIVENSLSEGLSNEEFYSMLNKQYQDAMKALDVIEEQLEEAQEEQQELAQSEQTAPEMPELPEIPDVPEIIEPTLENEQNVQIVDHAQPEPVQAENAETTVQPEETVIEPVEVPVEPIEAPVEPTAEPEAAPVKIQTLDMTNESLPDIPEEDLNAMTELEPEEAAALEAKPEPAQEEKAEAAAEPKAVAAEEPKAELPSNWNMTKGSLPDIPEEDLDTLIQLDPEETAALEAKPEPAQVEKAEKAEAAVEPKAVAAEEPKAEQPSNLNMTKGSLPDIPEEDLDTLIQLEPEEAAALHAKPEPAQEEKAETKEKSEDASNWAMTRTTLPDIPENDLASITDDAEKTEISENKADTIDDGIDSMPVVESIEVSVPEVIAPAIEVEAAAEDHVLTDAPAIEVPVIEDPQVDIPTVEPMDDDQPVFETQNDNGADDRLIIPSTEIPAAVITEEQRAKIREEVDAIANDDNTDYTGWMPRQIPVEKSAFSVEVIDKSELESVNNVITDVSRKNVKESILENTGVEIK